MRREGGSSLILLVHICDQSVLVSDFTKVMPIRSVDFFRIKPPDVSAVVCPKVISLAIPEAYGVFKSTDNGKTWKQLSGGLPAGIIQANLAIAASNSKRMFASIALPAGLAIYRSDDGGDSWMQITKDARPAGRIGRGRD